MLLCVQMYNISLKIRSITKIIILCLFYLPLELIGSTLKVMLLQKMLADTEILQVLGNIATREKGDFEKTFICVWK